jgi:hypothetical protein
MSMTVVVTPHLMVEIVADIATAQTTPRRTVDAVVVKRLINGWIFHFAVEICGGWSGQDGAITFHRHIDIIATGNDQIHADFFAPIKLYEES